ncbi:MAG: hypothetical protein JOY74_07785 [Sinobacteraceae bacterium]|nr:hypothetical protein [Nevskiaceae bacterium]MBV9317032.1 hypothetical protein [Gammaproteobacteria bacterium]
MKQRDIVLIGVMLGAFTTGIYSWWTRTGISGQALANTPLPAAAVLAATPESLAPVPKSTSATPAASPEVPEPPPVTVRPPAETPVPAPSDRVIAPPGPPGSPVRNSGRGKSKRDD